jgi:hypothetical protein
MKERRFCKRVCCTRSFPSTSQDAVTAARRSPLSRLFEELLEWAPHRCSTLWYRNAVSSSGLQRYYVTTYGRQHQPKKAVQSLRMTHLISYIVAKHTCCGSDAFIASVCARIFNLDCTLFVMTFCHVCTLDNEPSF